MADAMTSASMSMRAILLAGAVAVAALGGPGLAAQEVVQGLQQREASQLSAALRRLAQRPTDLDALVSAGNASLALRDTGAASGFFTRAANVAANDPRVMLGLARVALEQGRPVAALQGFARAESAGVGPLDMAADRGLAYDLVGDNAAAQALYRSALDADDDNSEVRRRLALSQAISGNRQEFERTLYPLLREEDRAAFRTRAFGLAVLGRPDEAVGIADAMMPTDLALRMAPYLRYMPRLTKAQQAAAGNLGAFPAAAEIGRDSAEIAGYASAGARIAANASASLTPAGAPLGTRPASAKPQSPPQDRPKPAATIPVRVATSSQATPGVLSPRPTITAANSTPAPTTGVLSQRPTTAAASPAPGPAPTPMPAPTPTPAPPAVVVAAASPTPAPTAAPPPAAVRAERQSLADAFAEFGGAPATGGSPAVGAVDIAKLTSVRRTPAATPPAAKPAEKPPVKPKPKPKAEKPAEPARIWVQVGVGRNTSAFAFDWRKLAKQAGGALDGKGPWAVKYGATNRMLAGPYATDAAAKAAIKRLKDKDIEALPFSSDEGEAVIKVG